jgi:hypothetical protein
MSGDSTNPATEGSKERLVAPHILESLDYVWGRVRSRCEGITNEEYLWEPAEGCWSVRLDGDKIWRVERTIPEPEPPPITTIAWRMWHIGSECLAGYVVNGLGGWPLPELAPKSREWFPTVGDAVTALDQGWSAFRHGLDRLEEDGMWGALGEGWGPYSEDPWFALAIHALDEISHHGAEVSLLRDLWLRRGER